MGVEVFTVRRLQSALGLSYHQTYRLLHGYTNNRATYTGILDKCPAVSYIDATVAGEMVEVGETVRRREHYFSRIAINLYLEAPLAHMDSTKSLFLG